MTKKELDTRNWMEKAIGKRLGFSPVCIGSKGGRKIYALRFEDGTEADYFIDFDRQEIEAY